MVLEGENDMLKDGDRNTKYYDARVMNRRRRNKVIMLKNDKGVWIVDVKNLQEMCTKFYRHLFTNGSHNTTNVTSLVTFPHLQD